MLCRPLELNIVTVLMISHRFHRRKMDRRLSLEIGRKTGRHSLWSSTHRTSNMLLPSFLYNGFKKCFKWAQLAEVQRCVLLSQFSRFQSQWSVFLRNEGRVIRIFYLKRLLASILPEFGNCTSRLNFTTSPPRDIRRKVEFFYLQVKWRKQSGLFVFVRVPLRLFNIGNLYKKGEI